MGNKFSCLRANEDDKKELLVPDTGAPQTNLKNFSGHMDLADLMFISYNQVWIIPQKVTGNVGNTDSD